MTIKQFKEQYSAIDKSHETDANSVALYHVTSIGSRFQSFNASRQFKGSTFNDQTPSDSSVQKPRVGPVQDIDSSI